jgi:chaperonin GroEL
VRGARVCVCMCERCAGVEGDVVVGKVLEGNDPNFGYNAQTGVYENLVSAGIIDPHKVVRTALVDAASVAGLMVTTESCIVDEKVDKPAAPMGGGGGGMGGMGGMGGGYGDF